MTHALGSWHKHTSLLWISCQTPVKNIDTEVLKECLAVAVAQIKA